MLLLKFPEYESSHPASACLSAAKPSHGASATETAKAHLPLQVMMDQLHQDELSQVEEEKSAHWHRVGLQKVEVVVEASCVQGREDEVDGLDQAEREAIVEAPSWMLEYVRDDLWHP